MAGNRTRLVWGSTSLVLGALFVACSSASPSASGNGSSAQVAGAQATATQAAPTVQALATQAAPPVQALATQVAPAVASAVALSPVQVVNAQVGTTDSTITLRNAGMSSVDLSGWTLRAGSTSVRVPGSPTVPPGGTITLHTGQATSTAGEVYLGQEGQMLAQALLPGATVLLVDPSGAIASQFMIPSR